MHYRSTRGSALQLDFTECLLAGLAQDGGLYLPETAPILTHKEIAAYAGQPFAAVACDLMRRFVGSAFTAAELSEMTQAAYASFAHPAVTPLQQIAPNRFVLELFHGPTLAFKDVAMQLLARMMDHVLQQKHRRTTIVGATSGDTGGAAIEAFLSSKHADVFILFPEGRVSEVQRRMMTTPHQAHIHALSIAGTFDDCQNLVKALFNDHAFREEISLSGVNSINWARIAAQVTYYFVAAVALGAPYRKVAFAVPTGNFGDIFAGYIAKQMGLPIERLIIATNSNDILVRALESGIYAMGAVATTSSPSMDIQISSNFERLLFEASGRDAVWLKGKMVELKEKGGFVIEEPILAAIRTHFLAARAGEDEIAATIQKVYRQSGYLFDPHSATAHVAADKLKIAADVPVITLATASPAKFPEIMRNFAGIEVPLPKRLNPMMQAEEKATSLPNSEETLKNHIRKNIKKNA